MYGRQRTELYIVEKEVIMTWLIIHSFIIHPSNLTLVSLSSLLSNFTNQSCERPVRTWVYIHTVALLLLYHYHCHTVGYAVTIELHKNRENSHYLLTLLCNTRATYYINAFCYQLIHYLLVGSIISSMHHQGYWVVASN